MTRPLSELGLGDSLDQNSQDNQHTADETNVADTETSTGIQSATLEASSFDHMRIIAENMQDLVCMHDATGKILYIASSCKALLDYSNDELINQYPKQFIHPNDLSKVDSALEAFNTNLAGHTDQTVNKPTQNFQFRAVHKNGSLLWLDCKLQGIFDAEGKLVAAISTSKDISHNYRTEKQLRYHATHDLLTGLNNRRLFKERLAQTLDELAAQADSTKQVAVLHIDIDRFKLINESLGHTTGDKLLKAIAKRIHSEVASIGVVFSIIEANEQELLDGSSLDSNTNTTTYTNADDMLGDAEISMYRSKASGKARYTIFDKAIHTDENASRRLQLESDLRTALKNDELFPLYHPILTLPSNKLTGFEVLLRWQHPKLGLISPGEFIPIAEETGLITEITLWLLEKACGELVIWQEKTGFDLNLSINLSPRMFSIANIDVELSNIIDKFPLNPASINLEITEGLLMEDMAYGAELLNRLRSRGLRTHIDDFGTGYCSLSYLHTLPIDALKIDKSFISGKGELHSGIVQTIISLAHNLEIPAIAEGIEDTNQLSILNDLNCDQAQGFLFSKPISVADVHNFLDKHTSSGYIVEFDGLESIGATSGAK